MYLRGTRGLVAYAPDLVRAISPTTYKNSCPPGILRVQYIHLVITKDHRYVTRIFIANAVPHASTLHMRLCLLPTYMGVSSRLT